MDDERDEARADTFRPGDAWAAIRAELARVADGLPDDTVGRTARAILAELGRHPLALGDTEGDAGAWKAELDLGPASRDTTARALRQLAERTPLIARVGRSIYAARIGRAYRRACAEGTAGDVAEAAAAPPTTSGAPADAWSHPDVRLALPRHVDAHASFGDALQDGSGLATPGLVRHLRRRGVVEPERLSRSAAQSLARRLRAWPSLLAELRRRAGIRPGEEHRSDYADRVAAFAAEHSDFLRTFEPIDWSRRRDSAGRLLNESGRPPGWSAVCELVASRKAA